MFDIIRTNTGNGPERVDTFDTEAEAQAMVKEYRLSDSAAHYYIDLNAEGRKVAQFAADLYGQHGEIDTALIAEEFGYDTASNFSPILHEDALTAWYDAWRERHGIEAGCARELWFELMAALDGEEASLYGERSKDELQELADQVRAFADYWEETVN